MASMRRAVRMSWQSFGVEVRHDRRELAAYRSAAAAALARPTGGSRPRMARARARGQRTRSSPLPIRASEPSVRRPSAR
jgi:hypothetical protein